MKGPGLWGRLLGACLVGALGTISGGREELALLHPPHDKLDQGIGGELHQEVIVFLRQPWRASYSRISPATA